ncbi:MAG: energy transducer TonB [Thermoanaerobaculia bacterium]
MTATPGSRLISVLALAVALALPAPVRTEAPPPDEVAATLARAQKLLYQEDYRNACMEFLHASELAQGKSLPSWIGLTQCSEELGDFGKAVDAARKARSLASTPKERTDATLALGCALLVKPDAQANAEAVALLKEEMANPEAGRLQPIYFQALFELNHGGEAVEFLHSLGAQDKVESLPCRVDPKQAEALNERLHAIDSELDVFPFGAKVTRPELIHQVQPEMTDEARKHPGFSGQVIVEAIIDRQGRVQDALVLKGQPFGLAESAIASVKQWRFKPATLNGRPVKVYYVLTVNFKVTDK